MRVQVGEKGVRLIGDQDGVGSSYLGESVSITVERGVLLDLQRLVGSVEEADGALEVGAQLGD